MSLDQSRWVLCGGIGSGKSTVRALLEAAGIHTIDADSIGHAVLEPEGEAHTEVASRWPSVVDGGRIRRDRLAEIVFHDPTALMELEGITHPHIFGRILRGLEGFADRVVVEVPLIGHGLGEEWGVIVVDADDDARIGRLMRRGMKRSDAEARMASQPARPQWLATADLVLPNHRDQAELRSTVSAAIEAL